MSFNNNTNQGRVTKIVEILELIEKSATSNKADTGEISIMLAPVVAKLDSMEMSLPPEPPTPAEKEEDPVPGGAWAASQNPCKRALLRDLAATAPLKDLSVVMAVVMDRFDELVEEHNG